MFSKVLIKLVDQAILPAILLVSVRVVSMLLFAKYFGLYVTYNYAGFVLSRAPGIDFTNPEDFIMINSYSTLCMIIVLAVVLLYILFKSLVFHDSHITPGLTARMFSLRLSYFIQSSYDLYSQGTVWLSYLYLLIIVTGIMAAFGIIYVWVFITGFLITVVSTAVFVIDIENELNLKKTQPSEYQEEEVVLKLEEF